MGIGADGIVLVEKPKIETTHCRFRIFNPDGSEAEMCGNGLRCLIKWLAASSSGTYRIETMESILDVSYQKDQISIQMDSPKKIEWNLSIPYKNTYFQAHAIHSGVPHAVLFFDSLKSIDFQAIGSTIRNDPYWSPKGTNVTCVEKTGNQRIRIRTFERGVEGETLACGTGAVAAALASAYQLGMQSPIDVEVGLGDPLKVNFSFADTQFTNVILTGTAQFVFEGQMDLK